MTKKIELTLSSEVRAAFGVLDDRRLKADEAWPHAAFVLKSLLETFHKNCATIRLIESDPAARALAYNAELNRLDRGIVALAQGASWADNDERLEPGRADAFRAARHANALRSDREFRIAVALHNQR